MKTFLAGVGAATVLFALTSFAFSSGGKDTSAASPPASKRTGAINLRDLTLDRAFQAVVPLTITNGHVQAQIQFPPVYGAGLTQVSLGTDYNGSQEQGDVTFQVNGTVFAKRWFASALGLRTITFDPPLVVAPGALLQISGPSLNNSGPLSATIGGWTLFVGDV